MPPFGELKRYRSLFYLIFFLEFVKHFLEHAPTGIYILQNTPHGLGESEQGIRKKGERGKLAKN